MRSRLASSEQPEQQRRGSSSRSKRKDSQWSEWGAFLHSCLHFTHRVIDDRHQHLRNVARIDGLDEVVPVVHLQGKPEDTKAKNANHGARILRPRQRHHGSTGAQSVITPAAGAESERMQNNETKHCISGQTTRTPEITPRNRKCWYSSCCAQPKGYLSNDPFSARCCVDERYRR